MQKTTNFGLKKPELTDNYEVNDFNYNADVIDAKLKELENNSSINTHVTDTVVHITEEERASWDSKASGTHTHSKAEITDFPTSLPASDVYSWAKESVKPSYTKSEVGLENVDNTSDANKNVKYATSAGNADTLDNLHASDFILANSSAKVIVSTTAPADTTAVWIIPS